jgi:hypothetical protein
LVILVSIVDPIGLSGGSHPPVATLSFPPLRGPDAVDCCPRPKSLSREAVKQAYSKLRRNCARIVPGPPARSVRRKRSKRGSSPARGTQGAAELSSATLVLDDRPSAFSTDAVNHDLIALPICRASRDLHRSRRHQKETSGKKRQQENQKQNSGMSEETPEQ